MTPGTSSRSKAGTLVARLEALGRRLMQAHPRPAGREGSLTMREFHVIQVAGARAAWTMGELATAVMVAVNTLTTVVDRLAAKQLVRRRRCVRDRRVVWVELTSRGRRLYERSQRHRLRMARLMLAPLKRREQDLFLVLMGKMSVGSGGAAPAPVARGVRGGGRR